MCIEEYQSNYFRLWREPRYCTFVGTAVAVAGLGLGAASAAGAFSPTISEPNNAAEATQMEQLQAEFLPAILGEQAAAQEGGQYTLPPDIAALLQQQGTPLNSGTVSPQQAQQLQALQTQLANTPQTLPSSGTSHAGNQPIPNPAYTQLQNQISAIQNSGGDTVNFQGQGTAQAEGQLEQQLAAGELAEGQQYDPQIIAQQLAEEQQANPQQSEARQAELQMMQNAIANPQTSPVSQTLQNQVSGQVAAGSGLTPEEQAMLNSAVTASGQSGTSGGSPDFSNELTTGFAGEQRALQNAGAGAQFLETGETPSDIQYRQQQADLGNLSSYISGQTPESQFSEISGAGQPIAPEIGTSYQPSFNGAAAAQQGEAGGINQYGLNVGEQLQVPNEWTAGLSSVLGGTNALAGAGVI
jgi:hypothetical protein